MKIQPSSLNLNKPEINNTSNKQDDVVSLNKNNSRAPADIESSAKVNVSQHARDIHKIRDVAMNSPDVDAAKVAHFRELINSGNYKVDSKSIADKMVDEELMLSSLEN